MLRVPLARLALAAGLLFALAPPSQAVKITYDSHGRVTGVELSVTVKRSGWKIRVIVDPAYVQSAKLSLGFDPKCARFESVEGIAPYELTAPPDTGQLPRGLLRNIQVATPAPAPSEADIFAVTFQDLQPAVPEEQRVFAVFAQGDDYVVVLDPDTGEKIVLPPERIKPARVGPGYGPEPGWINTVMPGLDEVQSSAVVTLDLNMDQKPDQTLILSGPVQVYHGGYANGAVPLELAQMTLHGRGGAGGGRVVLNAGDGEGNLVADGPLFSPGLVQPHPGETRDCDSFFDIFLEVSMETPGATEAMVLHNQVPVHMTAEIDRIPPQGACYESSQPVLLYTVGGQVAGQILSASHYVGPIIIPWEPPFWKGGVRQPMRDVDQKQDQWGAVCGPNGAFTFTWCGPVALANSLWWYADNGYPKVVPPEARNPLTGQVDPLKLVPLIAATANGGTPGCDGVTCQELFNMASAWVNKYAPGVFEVHPVPRTDLRAIQQELRKCQDVIILIGFYRQDATGKIVRVGGHFLTLAGYGMVQLRSALAFSDPYWDSCAVGASAGRFNGPDGDLRGVIHNVVAHNNPVNYSHDMFAVQAGPGGCLGLPGYSTTMGDPFNDQNLTTSPWAVQKPGTYIDCVFAVSPKRQPIQSSPTVVNGITYNGAHDGVLSAASAEDSMPADGFPVDIGAVVGAPVKLLGRPTLFASSPWAVYLTTDRGDVVKVNLDGTVAWAVRPDTTASGVSVTPAVTSDGYVFVPLRGASGPRVWKLNSDTGAPVMASLPLGTAASDISSPAIANNRLYVGLTDGIAGNIAVLNPANFTILSAGIAAGESVKTPPYVSGRSMFAGTGAGNFYKVSSITSNPDPSFGTGGKVAVGEPMSNSAFGDTNAATESGRIYVGTDKGKVFALDAITGTGFASPLFDTVDATAIVGGLTLNRTTGTLAFGAGTTFYEVFVDNPSIFQAFPGSPDPTAVFLTTPTYNFANSMFYIGANDGSLYSYPSM